MAGQLKDQPDVNLDQGPGYYTNTLLGNILGELQE